MQDAGIASSKMHATMHSGATCSDGEGITFDGVDDWVDLQDVVLGDSMTISVWGQYDSLSQPFSRIYDFGNGNNANKQVHLAHGRWPNGATDDLEARTSQGTAYSGATVDDSHYSGFWRVGEMTNVISVWSVAGSSTTFTLYRNGEKLVEKTNSKVRAPRIQRVNHFLGRVSDLSASQRLEGKIKAFTLWDRALSATDVAEAYAKMNGCAAPKTAGAKAHVNNGRFEMTREFLSSPHYAAKVPQGWQTSGNPGDIRLLGQNNAAWQSLNSGDGSQFVGLKRHGATIHSTVYGLVRGGSYTVTFLEATRPTYPTCALRAFVDGSVKYTNAAPSSSGFASKSFTFTASGPSAVLKFDNNQGNYAQDSCCFLDKVEVRALNVQAPTAPFMQIDECLEHPYASQFEGSCPS